MNRRAMGADSLRPKMAAAAPTSRAASATISRAAPRAKPIA
jgi:hypothetical protein